MTTNTDIVAARRTEELLSPISHALGLKIAMDLRQFDVARAELDLAVEALAVIEAKIPAPRDNR